MVAHDGLEKVGTSVNPLTTGIDSRIALGCDRQCSAQKKHVALHWINEAWMRRILHECTWSVKDDDSHA